MDPNGRASGSDAAAASAREAWRKRFGSPYDGIVVGLNEALSDDDLRLVVAIEGQRKIAAGYTFSLTLRDRPITDAGLAHLRNFGFLQEINLSNTQVTDRGLEDLATCTNLVKIDLSHTKVTDKGLESLGKLRRLRELDLRDTLVTDAGLKHLAEMNDLWLLELDGSKVTGTGVALLPQRKKLNVSFSAAVLPSDVQLDKLKEIWLGRVTYSLADFAPKVFPQERLDIHAAKLRLGVRLRGRGSFEWGLTMPAPVLLDWLKTYQINSLHLTDLPYLDDAMILGLPANHTLTGVFVDTEDAKISHPVVSDKGFAHLCRSKQLNGLFLPNVDLTAAGLAVMANCPRLRTLGFLRGRIRGVPANSFDGNALHEVTLENVTLPPGLLAWLGQNCQRITRLHVRNTKVAAKELAAFKELDWLELVNVGISDDDLVYLGGATKLGALDLSCNAITGRGFVALTGLKALGDLALRNTQIEASHLDRLGKLPDLKYLDCQDSPLTDEEAQRLANRHRWTFAGPDNDGGADITPK